MGNREGLWACHLKIVGKDTRDMLPEKTCINGKEVITEGMAVKVLGSGGGTSLRAALNMRILLAVEVQRGQHGV